MNPKRYWLKGALIGFTLPIIISLLFVTWLTIIAREGAFGETFIMVFVFLAWPAMLILTPVGLVLGWMYGKMKRSA